MTDANLTIQLLSKLKSTLNVSQSPQSPQLPLTGMKIMSKSLMNNSLYGIKNTIRSGVYYSPIILTFGICLFSLLYRTWKGVWFFIFLSASVLARLIVTNFLIKDPDYNKERIETWCSINDPNQTGNGFVIFYATYVILYMLAPMFIYSTYNWGLFSCLLIYLTIIVIYNYYDKCITKSTAGLNIVGGLICVIITVTMLVSSDNITLLFIDELDTDSNFCSMPTTQTFKCNVYKNGEVIASSLSS